MDKLKSDRMVELEWQMEDALQSIKQVKTKGYWFKEYEKLLGLYREEALRVAEALTA